MGACHLKIGGFVLEDGIKSFSVSGAPWSGTGLPAFSRTATHVHERPDAVLHGVGAGLGASLHRLQELADVGAGVERLIDVLLGDRPDPMDHRVHRGDDDQLGALVELLVRDRLIHALLPSRVQRWVVVRQLPLVFTLPVGRPSLERPWVAGHHMHLVAAVSIRGCRGCTASALACSHDAPSQAKRDPEHQHGDDKAPSHVPLHSRPSLLPSDREGKESSGSRETEVQRWLTSVDRRAGISE